MIACQSREEWLTVRRAFVTASNVAVVLGESPFSTPSQLWSEMSGLVKSSTEEAEWMKWGSRLEDAIARGYVEENGGTLISLGALTVLQSLRYPWMAATLDRLVEVNGELMVLECKNVSSLKADEWEDEPPLHYQIQVQAQLACTGLKRGVLVALIGGNRLAWFIIDRNDEFIDAAAGAARRFKQKVDLGEFPDEVDGSAKTSKALAKAWRKRSDDVPLVGEDFDELTASLVELDTSIKLLEEQRGELRNRVALELDKRGVEAIRTPGGVTWRYVTVEKPEHVVKASTTRQLRRSKK